MTMEGAVGLGISEKISDASEKSLLSRDEEGRSIGQGGRQMRHAGLTWYHRQA